MSAPHASASAHSAHSSAASAAATAAATATSYRGLERRKLPREATNNGTHELSPFLCRMLDEIDYGMLLVTEQAQITFQNHAARTELDGEHPLRMQANLLGTRGPEDAAALQEALAAAQRGLRRLLNLGQGEQRVSISVVPLSDPASALRGGSGYVTLLTLGKRQVCSPLSVQGFARSFNMTPAETRVLEALCAGLKPNVIAEQGQVAVSTVRTQIGSIRVKTGAASIRELVRQVAVLPPLVGALRGLNGA